MTIFAPSSFSRKGCIARAMTSVLPPGAKATTISMGLSFGHSACAELAPSARAADTGRFQKLNMVSSGCYGVVRMQLLSAG